MVAPPRLLDGGLRFPRDEAVCVIEMDAFKGAVVGAGAICDLRDECTVI